MSDDAEDRPTAEDERFVAALLADAEVWHDLPADSEDRAVAAMLDAAAEPERDDADGLLAAVPGAGAGAAAPAASRAPASARWAWLTAAAASVALLAVVLVPRLVTTASDIEVTLAATDLAPSTASAVAAIDETPLGTRIVLDVEGLPPAEPGTYYEAWLRTGPEVGVSAGTFHLRGGDGSIELWSAVSPSDYPLLTVTVQDEDGTTDSSGRVVLSARLDEVP